MKKKAKKETLKPIYVPEKLAQAIKILATTKGVSVAGLMHEKLMKDAELLTIKNKLK
jgi:hypothetical protein